MKKLKRLGRRVRQYLKTRLYLPSNAQTIGPEAAVPKTSNQYGVKVWQDRADAAVDICFVHGITGSRDTTWSAHGEAPWPQGLLAPRLDRARVLTYGYDAYVVQKSGTSSNRLADHARNLLHDLTRCRHEQPKRPLIFVTHSLGGLVCKEAILQSRNNPEPHLRAVFDNVRGVVFMGTPHRGSWMASWATFPVAALGVVRSTSGLLLDVLQINNEYLQSVHSRFMEMVREQRESGRLLDLVCFYEELPMPVVGRVVSKESATIDSYSAISIHANHRDMVRFKSADDLGFSRLLAELTRWESSVLCASSDRPAEEELPVRPILSRQAQACLQSLSFPQMFDRFHDVDEAVDGTCIWLLQHRVYKEWKEANKSAMLWVKGKPGSGKSTLLKHALNNITAGENAILVSFFFHGRGNDLQKTPLGFYQSFLHQLLQESPDALSGLVDTYANNCETMGRYGEKWQWHPKQLQKFIELCLPTVLQRCQVWLFVDALDESGEKDAVELFRWLESLLLVQNPSGPRHPIHVCVTCRHYPILASSCEFEICPEHENKQDIEVYVHTRLRGSFSLAGSEVESLITGRASGVFLWARLVVNQVLLLDNDGASLANIKREIHAIPDELDQLYRKLIQNVAKNAASKKLIQWVCFAMKPLSVAELRWAMAVEAECPYRTLKEYRAVDDYEPSNSRLWRRLQRLSCGLVETISEEFREAPPRSVVQFIHQTVKDFFIEGGILLFEGCDTSSDAAIGMAHMRLAQICIRFTMLEEVAQAVTAIRDTRRNDIHLSTFYRYAVIYWAYHAKECERRNIPQEELVDLVTRPIPKFKLLELNESKWHDSNWRFVESGQETTLLHIAAKYGILALLVAILKRPSQFPNVDVTDTEKRTPFFYAAAWGHDAVVQRLLQTGQVDLNSKDVSGITALSLAAYGGHKAVVQQLLQTGLVDVDGRDCDGWTPLSYAAAGGHDAIVRQLLETGSVDVKAQDRDRWTPLTRAAHGGHDTVVQLLLQCKQTKANLRDKDGLTPLFHAATEGHESIVQQLLQKDRAGANLRDGSGRTPLSRAAEKGHSAVVEVLLQAPRIKVDPRDDEGITPLSYAASEGHEAIVQRLLQTGAVDVNTRDNYGRTPLAKAAFGGHDAIVRLLLQTERINLDVKDKDGYTPLAQAASMGRDAVVQRLLASGQCNVNSQNTDGQTPLSLAAERKKTTVVHRLIETGQADVDLKDSSGRTPLSYAAAAGCDVVVRQLLQTGRVAIDSKDKEGRTPLSYATAEPVIELLDASSKGDAGEGEETTIIYA